MNGFHVVPLPDHAVTLIEAIRKSEPRFRCSKCGERFTSECRLHAHERCTHPKLSLSTKGTAAIERAIEHNLLIQECFPEHTQPASVEDEIRACKRDRMLPRSFRCA
mmetsp:Transcript_6322/g.10882  ORF Transcript_6322/g.10882 Transcript_6322/m.10882 type:complete len:107 (+) Transcript_6322:367-687(+)